MIKVIILGKEVMHVEQVRVSHVFNQWRTVERAIDDLVRAGLVTKEQRWRENGGRSSLLFTLKGN